MKINLLFCLLIIISKKNINCGNKPCFEYSCDECETEEFGKCIKCREGFKLINGTCPCSDSTCALCESGLAGLHLCYLCKNGYFNYNNDCYCSISNCEHCSENGCLKCKTGYFYNITSNICEIETDEQKIKCFDEHCDSCFSEEKGACDNCQEGYFGKKGECHKLPIPDENNNCPENFTSYSNVCKPNCGGISCPIINFNFFSVYYTCPSNECLVCVGNELKLFSECDNSRICSIIEGCLNCISNEECIICNQGYYLLLGICIKCIDGCSICTNNNTCEYCMSGYELSSDKKCNLTYNFDYNINVYNSRKETLIEFFYPEEVVSSKIPSTIIKTEVIPTDIQNSLVECDINCEKCYENNGECVECKTLYILKDNKCIMHCSDENCLSCLLRNGREICDKCTSRYTPKNNKCLLICSDENCLSCSLNNGKEICNNCKKGYIPNDEKCSLVCSEKNCLKCSLKNNAEMCEECSSGYELNNGKCSLICLDENCLKCSLSNNDQFCYQCKTGYLLKNKKCLVQCDDVNCLTCSNDGKICNECEVGKKLFDGGICGEQSVSCTQLFPNCNYCYNSEKCLECLKGYEIDDTTNINCKKKANFISTVFTILGIGIIIIGIISFCIYQKRKNDLRSEIRRIRLDQEHNGNTVNIFRDRNALDFSSSGRTSLNKDDLSEEFEVQKRKMEKGKPNCQFCKKKQAKFQCDCGCFVCKEHSNLKKVEGDGENYKVCFACNKIVKKVTQIKYKCNICFQNRINVVHFKCGCALEVCKDCYIKCKMGNNKCPGCRAII